MFWKTTIIEKLAQKGFHTLDETAKQVITLRKHIPMSVDEPRIRQHLIFKRQYTKEKRAYKENYNLLFLDRSLIDGLGYSVLYNGEDSIKQYIDVITHRKYDYVFMLDRLPFDSEGFRQKHENEKEAQKIHDSIFDIYKRFGYNPIKVPVMPVKERVEFILERI